MIWLEFQDQKLVWHSWLTIGVFLLPCFGIDVERQQDTGLEAERRRLTSNLAVQMLGRRRETLARLIPLAVSALRHEPKCWSMAS